MPYVSHSSSIKSKDSSKKQIRNRMNSVPDVIDLTTEDEDANISSPPLNPASLDKRVTQLEYNMGIYENCNLSLDERVGILEKRMGISLYDRVCRLELLLASSITVDHVSSMVDMDKDTPATTNTCEDDETITRVESSSSDEATWKEEDSYEMNQDNNNNLPYGIRKRDDWNTVWEKMKRSGWSWKKGRGLHTFYFIKPGSTIQGGKEYDDYFTTEVSIQDHLQVKYGWCGRRNIHSST